MTSVRPPPASYPAALWLFVFFACANLAAGRDFSVRLLSEPGVDARNPALGASGLIAWQGHRPHVSDTPLSTRSDVTKAPPGSQCTDIFIWRNGEIRNITGGSTRIPRRSERPRVFGDSIVFTAWFKDDAGGGFPFELATPPKNETMRKMESEYPTLFDPPFAAPRSALEADLSPEAPEQDPTTLPPEEERNYVKGSSMQFQQWRTSGTAGDIALYGPDETILRITPGSRHFNNPVMSEAGIAFQVARGWPYGYEILTWKPGDNSLTQLTTNYFYVLNPNIHASELVFQGWDGNDHEIFRHRFDTGVTEQITDNQFDDTNPVVWSNEIAWIAHPTVNAEIFHLREGVIRKISEDSKENASPVMWNGRVVWQGYDDTDLEIYYFDGRRTIKLTSNTWDDLSPDLRDGVITWMSYVDNASAEIMALDLGDNIAVRLTDNQWEDSFPQTAAGRIVWQVLTSTGSSVMIAEPKGPRAVEIE